MASLEAACSIHVQQPEVSDVESTNGLHEKANDKQTPYGLHEELISAQMGNYDGETLAPHESHLVFHPGEAEVSFDTRLQWAKSISEQFLNRDKLDDSCGVRDWDIILNLDGSVENHAHNGPQSATSTRAYAVRYRIPEIILERYNTNKEKVQRAELFALGSFLYYVFSGKEIFDELGSSETAEQLIETYFIKGLFPEDIWELPRNVRILSCWCPEFAKDLLAAKNTDESYRSKVVSYMKRHPILFGFQVVGGIASLASIVALPILGAVGFSAAGPVAGSAAAAWQSSIGLVQAGSIFAWCQSAAMGGAAVGGIIATGLAGAGVAVGATLSGALDNVETTDTDFKSKFLIAWRRDIGETEE